MDIPPKPHTQTCDGCTRTERKLSRKELPNGWITQAIGLADGRTWIASFCPECQKDLERSVNRARASVDE